MSAKTIGTCSNCGGRVTVPTEWLGIHPPVPSCQSCGAMKAEPYGPVVKMGKGRSVDPRAERWAAIPKAGKP